MADGNSHPFNNDVIADDTIVQLQKQLSHQQQHHQNISKHKDLIDLLSSNNTSNHFLNTNDPSINISSQTITDDDFNRLKSIIRSTIWSIDNSIRRQLWMNILTLNRVSTSKQQNEHRHLSQIPIPTLSVTIDNSLFSLTSKFNQWPNYVDTTNICLYHLTEPSGRLLLQRILFTFALHHPDLTYCPALEPFSSLLLHYFNEHEVLYLINRLLIKHWLCGETRLQWEANCNVFKKLLKLYYKSTADAIELRYPNTKIFYQEWFWWIFRYLPFSYLVKIMDCFFLEGPKILYRVGLALVHLFIKTVKNESSGSIRNMADFCQQIPISIDQLLRAAFHIRNLKRSTIEQLVDHEEKLLHSTRHSSRPDELDQSNNLNSININSNNNLNNNGNINNHQSIFITPQHLTRIPKTSVLDHQQFVTLWNWLPVRLSLTQPHLVFTTQEHGFRLQTLLDKINEIEYSILIIKTTNGEIFGGFCAGLWSDRHNKTYFGFGESFLFTLLPKQTRYSWVGQQQDSDNRQHQLKRELFLFVNNEKIIIGGGNGDGLCIDASLCEGRTAHCETFNNEPLCSSPYFSISMNLNYLILLTFLHTNIYALKPIHLTIVVCGYRLDEALNALKSSLIFTPSPLIFHIFTEDHLRAEFLRKIDLEWPVEYQSKFQIEFYPIQFTRGNDEQWRTLFKPCCTQRLFIPDVLKNIDSVIYVDTDTLFLSNVRSLWRLFRKFNSTQLAALTAEHEDPSMGWYNRFARHPYYGAMGLNSGVMLMNLTRMRQVDMISKIMDIFDEYHMNITWGDQCLLNIYFNYYPEQIYEFSCDWNYRPDHCIYENNCQIAKTDGIKILHGCRSAFHNDKYQEFKAIYQVIQNWKFDSDLKLSLLSQIKTNLKNYSLTNCGKASELFTKHLSKEISLLDHSFKKIFHIAFIFNDNWNFIEQSHVLLKSLLLFSSNNTNNQIHLHVILTDNHSQNYFSKQIESMDYLITYYNSTITHPFQLSTILNVDRVVYLNPNMIFINSFDKLWSLFDQFQSKQIIGMFGQCQMSGSSNVLLLHLNEMKNMDINFERINQLSTDNVYFLPCKYILDTDHCQSIKHGLLLFENINHSLFGSLYKLISQIDLIKSNDAIEIELNQIKNLQCRNELVKLIIENKKTK
ncbi:unnamed protein product [Adineta steineri]|uniref:UDP-D-xylose:beta-D-glucoside alpha-1,3-D-xylosyltransferase n=1 Tax=Adineta steineri TaxID=433720 RepID=A0A814BWQ1_9BILA|nr:unnamed protein product [Adineta steineri]CAF1531283.1 unnamed protein product [Adineta steineri]